MKTTGRFTYFWSFWKNLWSPVSLFPCSLHYISIWISMHRKKGGNKRRSTMFNLSLFTLNVLYLRIRTIQVAYKVGTKVWAWWTCCCKVVPLLWQTAFEVFEKLICYSSDVMVCSVPDVTLVWQNGFRLSQNDRIEEGLLSNPGSFWSTSYSQHLKNFDYITNSGEDSKGKVDSSLYNAYLNYLWIPSDKV